MAAQFASDEIDRRLERFSKVVVQHAAMQAVLGRLKRIIRHPPKDGIPYLCGHAGTGKSQTLDVLEQDLIEDSLRAVREPMIEHKIGSGKDTAYDFRDSLTGALKHRKVRAFLIDESHHIGRVGSVQVLQHNADAVKSLAEDVSTVLVLAGTYELLPLMQVNPEIERRGIPVFFPRYQLDDDEDVRAFADAAVTLAVNMPVDEPPNLAPHLELLYQGSLGCVGILKNWLHDALAVALERGSRTVTVRDLEETVDWAKVRSMLSKMLDAEARLDSQEDAFRSVRQQLAAGRSEETVDFGAKRPSRAVESGHQIRRKPATGCG